MLEIKLSRNNLLNLKLLPISDAEYDEEELLKFPSEKTCRFKQRTSEDFAILHILQVLFMQIDVQGSENIYFICTSRLPLMYKCCEKMALSNVFLSEI